MHEQHRMHHVPPLVESPGKNVGLNHASCTKAVKSSKVYKGVLERLEKLLEIS